MQSALVVVEAYALGYVAATQRAVLQRLATDLTTAYMTAWQEDDLRPSLHADHTLRAPRSLDRSGCRGGDGGPWGERRAGHLDARGGGKRRRYGWGRS